LLFTLVHIEQGCFARIGGNRDNDLVKDPDGPLDDVKMAIGYGIEGSWIYSDLMHIDSSFTIR
jgi:hypothetical protein